MTSAAAPLLVALHGYTQSADDLNRTSEWYKLAGRFHFYLIYAQAPGNRAFYWYTPGRARGQPDPAGIIAMVDHEKMIHHIDADRVFVTGMSAGGYMAIDVLADYPEVFAAGAIFAGGAYGCDSSCAMTPAAGSGATGVRAAYPTVWNSPSARKPRLMLFQGDLDGVNAPGNMEQVVRQWTGALGTDATPDNAALGLPTTLKGYPYNVYAAGSSVAVATVSLVGLGHGTPVQPGSAPDEGGFDPMPGATQPPGYFDPHDWTNTGMIYGPYYAAQFFGLVQ